LGNSIVITAAATATIISVLGLALPFGQPSTPNPDAQFVGFGFLQFPAVSPGLMQPGVAANFNVDGISVGAVGDWHLNNDHGRYRIQSFVTL
jgi:hypothetical protein